jgi:radical SAM superfamily enzyme YgiQ (UPF0313 family)
MIRVLLCHPPQPNSLDAHLDPPLGLLYIAAFLEEWSIQVDIVDLTDTSKNWEDQLYAADIYGITVYTASLGWAQKIAQRAKEYNPYAPVVVGGPHPSALPKETSQIPEFDSVICGEGELAFLQVLMEYVWHGTVPSLHYTSFCNQIDRIPYPARHLVEASSYTRTVMGHPAVSLLSSRGCPFACTYCSTAVFGRSVRRRSVDDLIEEMTHLQGIESCRHFLFMDDVFATDSSWLQDFAHATCGSGAVFRCNGHVRRTHPGDYEVLYRAGCREIAFGIESGSQKILDAAGKGTTVEEGRDAIQYAKEVGLITRVYLMFGFPGEDERTVDETMQFIEETDPDQHILFTFVPLPGTLVWEKPELYGITKLSKNFEDYYLIAGENSKGGAVFETEHMDSTRFEMLRDELLAYLNSRQQRGHLQHYLTKVNAGG